MSEPNPDQRHLGHACRLAVESVQQGGGPFGAVVVRGEDVVGVGTNRVTIASDPTAHAEVEALRAAGEALGDHDLSGSTLYTSCRPCPMCMTAAWWARVDRVVFAAWTDEAAAAGFDDSRFWERVRAPETGPVEIDHVPHPDGSAPFDAWRAHEGRRPY